MKKESVIKLYSMLPNNKDTLTQSLGTLLNVKGKSEDILLKLCEGNDDIIFDENLNDYIDLSIFIGNVEDSYYRNLIMDNMIKLLRNPIIIDYSLTRDLVDQMDLYLEFNYWNYFNIDYSTLYFYPSYVINELTKFFEKIKNYEMDHEIEQIFDCNIQLMNDLNNTECNKYNDEEIRLKRISTFFDVISDEDVYNLDDYKFYVVLEACKTATNVDEMKRIKYIVKFNKNLSDDEFSKVIDASISDFTALSIDKIYKEINYHVISKKEQDGSITTISPKPKNMEKIDDVLQKVLNRNKKNLILNKK